MKNFLTLKSISGLFVASMILVSCAQSDQVVSNKLIQKRKYNKGFFINKASKTESLADNKVQQESSKVEAVVANNEVSSTVNFATFQASTNEVTPVVINTEVKKEEAAAIEIKSTLATKVVTRKIEKLIEKANKAELNSKVDSKKESKSNKRAGDSQVIALILGLVAGGLGIHRFYLGYTWQGVVQLLTGGGCGIWALIDIIRIITGDLQPNGGRYSKTL